MDDEVYKIIKFPIKASEVNGMYEEMLVHPRFKECVPTMELKGHPDVGLAAYMVPIDLHRELTQSLYRKTLHNGQRRNKASTI